MSKTPAQSEIPSTAVNRLQKEYSKIIKESIPNIEAIPLENNILEWHFVIKGPLGTDYEGGYYHGVLIFPKLYPYKPPRIMMKTPSGRFKPDTRLCLSMSDFHPETWNPMWSVSSILSGLLSFMLENDVAYGTLYTTRNTKKHLARLSLSTNLKDKNFSQLFPHYFEIFAKEQSERRLRGESEPEPIELDILGKITSRISIIDIIAISILIGIIAIMLGTFFIGLS